MAGLLAKSIIFFFLCNIIAINAKFPKKFSKEKLTHLHFYFHDIVTAPPNATVVQVAAAPNSMGRVTPFGSVNIADDLPTETPEITSKLIGRAQGLYASVSQSEISFLMAINFVFTEEKYNGSTISIFGKNSILSEAREMPVIGGTGIFRFARGYALARTYASDATSLNGIVEYNVYVLNY